MTSNLAESPAGRAVSVRLVAPAVLIVALLAIVFAQWIPRHFHSFTVFDSGLFLYVGEQLRQGHRLYRDVWDHKPPIIFLFNEIGLMLGGGSPAGVLLLDYVFCLVFFLATYRAMRQLFCDGTALLALLLGILFFRDITPQPNLGEVVSLPFQFPAFLLLLADLEYGISLKHAASQGILFALLFWTRPDGIAISVIYCGVMLVAYLKSTDPLRSRLTKLSRALAAFVSGVVAVSAAIVIPFAMNSSWREVWFATFTFNQLYAGLTTVGERFRALWWMIQYGAQHGFILLAAAGVISILWKLRWSSMRSRAEGIAAIWFLLELLFAAYTGKQYGKNLIPILLPAMVCIASLCQRLVETRAGLPIASAVVFCFTVTLSVSQYRENAKARPDPDGQLLSEVQKLSRPDDRVTFWGVFSPATIFAAHRSSGTRFFSSIPLSHGEPLYRRLAPTALDDLERSRSKLIVQRSDGQIPSTWDTAALAAQKALLMQNYDRIWGDAETKTIIYERR
ncbi:MAG TPA: hypothetical protein VN633_14100 [Bryobacteraceae bacterium]|nr:hypothetical protein [Bryobacteraceae bacterium]